MFEPPADGQRSPEIDEERASFADAIRNGDPNAAASAYTDTARLLPPSADLIEGRASIAAFWQAGFDAGVVDVEHQALTVTRRDRMAYEVGRYALQLRLTDGEMVVDRGTYVVVLEEGPDGAWRRAVEMFSPGPKGGRMAPSS